MTTGHIESRPTEGKHTPKNSLMIFEDDARYFTVENNCTKSELLSAIFLSWGPKISTVAFTWCNMYRMKAPSSGQFQVFQSQSRSGAIERMPRCCERSEIPVKFRSEYAIESVGTPVSWRVPSLTQLFID